MSVINKVLRDLDRRQTEQVSSRAAPPQGQNPLRTGIASVGGAGRRAGAPVPTGASRWLGGVLLLSVVFAAVYWYGPTGQQAAAPAASVPVVVVTSAQSAEPEVTAATETVSAPEPEPAAPVQAPPARPETIVKKEAPTSPVTIAPPRLPLQEAPVALAPAKPAQLAAAVPQLPAPVAAPQKTQNQIAMEVLAQAQLQWSDGDQAGALQVVQGVISSLVQRPASDSAALVAAAREYVRMVMAQQRPADALAMLVRLEPQLTKVADIWALRGNAAQRLGLHAQAVHAYLNALELQPGQARWLLAVAVSLAAQGQTTSAAEFADKARRGGFLPPDVANYLKQLGVALQAR